MVFHYLIFSFLTEATIFYNKKKFNNTLSNLKVVFVQVFGMKYYLL